MSAKGTPYEKTYARIEALEAEVESLRAEKQELAGQAMNLRTRAMTAEAKLAEVEKERDDLDLQARDLRVELDAMTRDRDKCWASIERARELAEADTTGPGVFLDQRLERIALILKDA